MSKKIYFFFVLVAILAIIFYRFNFYNGNRLTEMKVEKNGDAKFMGENVITSENGKLVILNSKGEYLQKTNVDANWIDAVEEDNIIVYGNFNNEIGVVKIDSNYNVIENNILLKDTKLNIDPTITKYNDKYYITITNIIGNVNNSDVEAENGLYTVRLFELTKDYQFNLITDIVSYKNNIEDVDFLKLENSFALVFEKEVFDKKNSSVNIIFSQGLDGVDKWSNEKELLAADCDHEPAVFIPTKTGYSLYYSCDKDNVGLSYSGGKLYISSYDSNFNCINKDTEIKSENNNKILLYDVRKQKYFLYDYNYLGNKKLFIEKISKYDYIY